MILSGTARWMGISSIAICVALAASPAVAQSTPGEIAPATPSASTLPAQTASEHDASPGPGGVEAEDIVVTGVRASLRSARNLKRDANQIVDSIVAEDIGKLPDQNVAEALQRVTGVQISRNQGEGSGVAIRGLTQVRTELNGRTFFTASGNRGLSFEDIPSELLGRADVYKSPTADQIEGGIGGIINLVTRKPLDWDPVVIAGSVRVQYQDFADKASPQVSGLMSQRWDTGVGPIGILVSGAYQNTSFRTDYSTTQPFDARNDLADVNGNGVFPGDPGDTILAPGGGGSVNRFGDRHRIGLNTALQWQPTPDLDLYANGTYSKYIFKENAFSIFTFDNYGTLAPAGPFTVNDKGDFVSGSYRNAVVDSYSFINDRRSRTYQFAGGGAWTPGAFSLAADLSYTQSNSNTDFASLAFGATAPVLRQDLSGKFQSLVVEGIDLANPNSYVFDRTSEYYARNTGSELAGRVDAGWKADGGFVRQLKAGFRYTETSATNTAISFADRSIAGTPVSAFPGAAVVQNTNLFYRITDNPGLPTQLLAPPIDIIRNFGQIRSVFGQPIEGPQADPLSSYDLTENTYAGYVVADLALTLAGVEITGNVGVRAVRTETRVSGFQALPAGALGPLEQGGSYTNWLPNLNLKAQLTDGLILRVAANKGVARSSFSLLSPSLFLDYQFRTGYAGNPALAPFKSDNYDVSAEYYFSKTGYAYVAGFYKQVDGFIQTITNPETYGGQVFQVQRPSNGTNGKIKGAEVGVQAFFDFLPAPLDGFGVQANYTLVDSEAPGPIAGQSVPLEGLSRNSYNLIGLYEKGPLSARVAYNWRSSFVQTTAGPGTGSNPLFNRGGGVLDASISYELSKAVTFTIDAVNLTRTRNLLYYGQENRPNEFSITDRRFGARLQFRF